MHANDVRRRSALQSGTSLGVAEATLAGLATGRKRMTIHQPTQKRVVTSIQKPSAAQLKPAFFGVSIGSPRLVPGGQRAASPFAASTASEKSRQSGSAAQVWQHWLELLPRAVHVSHAHGMPASTAGDTIAYSAARNSAVKSAVSTTHASATQPCTRRPRLTRAARAAAFFSSKMT